MQKNKKILSCITLKIIGFNRNFRFSAVNAEKSNSRDVSFLNQCRDAIYRVSTNIASLQISRLYKYEMHPGTNEGDRIRVFLCDIFN